MVPVPGGSQWTLESLSQWIRITLICIKMKDRIRHNPEVKSRIRSRTKVKSRIRERTNVRGICNTGIRDWIWIRFRIQPLPKKVTVSTRVGKNPFFYKPSPVGFLGFFGFFWVFCPDERVIRVFFSFTNTFRCIQTLNYNHFY
jgi:hypothetical protein